MRIYRIKFLYCIFCLYLCIACNEMTRQNNSEKPPTAFHLKDKFAQAFKIGAAINKRQILQTDTAGVRLLKEQFSSITPENNMKWERIHPAKDSFFFDLSDTYIKLGNKNNLEIIGHTLVWHSQIAPYMHNIEDSTAMSDNLKKHIHTVVGRYKGKVDGWDVVNEALNADGSLRESIFYKVIGKEYVSLAFKLAAQADPEAELYYNDYDMWQPKKREGAIRLVKQLQKDGVRIDGIGMQAHLSLTSPSLEEIEQSILAYSI